jgi:hypothetical protein
VIRHEGPSVESVEACAAGLGSHESPEYTFSLVRCRMSYLPESFIVIPADAGIPERRLVPDFRQDDAWTSALAPNSNPGIAGEPCRNPLPYL